MIFNQFKTVLLLTFMSSLFLLAGSALGGSSGLKIALILALVMNVITYFFSDRLVLSMYGAKPLDQNHYGMAL